ncbi:hypothetical protein [Subtercola sp. YIM 133946]|uniref:hypothetical protein n=1 Tax=Subtercola sp. YIM 133946 TaxID=3118909 RepID=UPI002F93FF02
MSIPIPQPPSTTDALPRRRRRRGVAIAAVVLGTLVLASAGVGVAVALGAGIDLGLVGLVGVIVVFGGLAFALRLFPNSSPGAGLARGAVGFVALAAVVGLLYFFIYPAAQTGTSWLPSWGMHAAAPPRAAPVTVVFEVTGTAPRASISSSPVPAGSSSATSEQALPFTQTLTVDATSSTFYILNASTSEAPDDATVSCTITVDGTVVAHESDTGSFGLALCSGRVPTG